jgi:glycosyltransferase involved in cell wall biosynthesis
MFYGRRLRALLREPWDLVHCWEEPYVLGGGQVAWLTPRPTPFVFWTAQNISKRYPPPFSWIEKYCLDRCAGWLACGESIVQTLLPRGYGRKPHRVMPLGIDLEVFGPDRKAGGQVRRRLGWEEVGPPVVGFLGRFVPEKGAPLLDRSGPDVPFGWVAADDEFGRVSAFRAGRRRRYVLDVP